ncbi:MAG: D-alanine--D-alanine ligase [candidate division Zixibacteria bacterium]|nr:D-alanine--D-alanine ligase [candidate division Zixibacteria bacterium]
MDEQKLNILVLAGGESGERDVSLDSSRAIARALSQTGHNVTVLDTLTGHFLDSAFIESDEYSVTGQYILSPKEDTDEKALLLSLIKARDDGVEVVFNGLHGGAGENGSISALLDFVGLPYTGSPMAASAVAMNKDISKRVMWSLNIPTAKWHPFYKSIESHDDIAALIAKEFQLPVIIKPVDCGSTVGLSLVEETDKLVEAVISAFEASDIIMAETYFKGREITIAVLDGEPLPPVEIVPSHKLYDYTCKYTKGKSQYFCPADIDENIIRKLSNDAVRLYKSTGCTGYTRVDFIVSDLDHYICLELNTLPGMTELSLFPMAAKEIGLDFPQLLIRLCQLAMERK